MITSASLLIAAPMMASGFRPPAVPLVTHDPYFSLWSRTDKLTDGPVCHWTGTPQPLTSLVKVDGKVFRIMGAEPADVPAMAQTGLEVTPTRTMYTFSGSGVEVSLRFTSPLLTNDLDLFSRPVSYLTWSVKSADKGSHEVDVYFGASPVLAVNHPDQEVAWSKGTSAGMTLLKVGTVDQPVLDKRGDDLRIDWGHLMLGTTSKAGFGPVGDFGAMSSTKGPKQAGEAPTLSTVMSFGKVGAKAVSNHVLLGYDDEYSIQLMGHDLRPYWRRNGMDGAGMMALAAKEYEAVEKKCAAFDKELTADMTKAGGANYAYIGALAYRQSFAAQKVVADDNGQPLMFSKENFSNGCIATVDVLYPAAPQMLLFSPTLVKASMTPLMEYSASPRWKFPFAPHDMGTYPKANGQVYGGGESNEDNQMPVEETGNMIILLAALAHSEGNANYSAQYWPTLTKWAEYLASKGFDPERQLSTDDFAGHLAHNVNLSVKAIMGLDCYATLAEMLGKKDEAAKYHAMAKQFAQRWVNEAKEGDHYRLAFDQAGSWSQKYNLVWDRILGLGVFPDSVATEEMAFYKTKMNEFGLPLDNRREYTKLDWEVWTASLTGKKSDFEAIIDRIVAFLNKTPDRVPMSDWYETVSAKKSGFQARSVVGGVFIKMLDTPDWKKYVARDKNTAHDWAKLPTPVPMKVLMPTAREGEVTWKWLEEKPADGWTAVGFDDSHWGTAPAGFGQGDNRGGQVRTPWMTQDIWIRKSFDLGDVDTSLVRLVLAHDDGAEVYINGERALSLGGASGYEVYRLPSRIAKALKKTGNVIAIHCHDDGGDRYVDAGFSIALKK